MSAFVIAGLVFLAVVLSLIVLVVAHKVTKAGGLRYAAAAGILAALISLATWYLPRELPSGPAPNADVSTASPKVGSTDAPEPTPTVTPTPFSSKYAQTADMRTVTRELADSIFAFCSSGNSDAEAERVFTSAMQVVVGRLKRAGLSSIETETDYSLPQDCSLLSQEARSTEQLAQQLR